MEGGQRLGTKLSGKTPDWHSQNSISVPSTYTQRRSRTVRRQQEFEFYSEGDGKHWTVKVSNRGNKQPIAVSQVFPYMQ
jgi:hypothetical protein